VKKWKKQHETATSLEKVDPFGQSPVARRCADNDGTRHGAAVQFAGRNVSLAPIFFL
jgi:hypothetical protein